MINNHPSPQFAREHFRLLNGEWQFESNINYNKINSDLSEKIIVPYCPESRLSGIGKHVSDHVMYSRLLDVSKEELQDRLVLNFGAVGHFAKVYVNGVKIGEHRGSYTPFSFDIAPYCFVGENRITLIVTNDVGKDILSGKQSDLDHSYGCFYTRCTGIWQSVWLENTPKTYVIATKLFPDAANGKVKAEVRVSDKGNVDVQVMFAGKVVGTASGEVSYRHTFEIDLAEKHLWDLEQGNLYDVKVSFGGDVAYFYFGLRDVCYDGYKFLLNGRSVFQRLVLDQGYYQDGIYTGSDEQYVQDINLARSLGFNGARLHQKVFDPRFLYYCDKMGYIVWGEYASWGIHYSDLAVLGDFVSEWTETVERDFNHPSIITWCPLNETWADHTNSQRVRDPRFVEAMYFVTKTLDETRPCVDVSGGHHGRFTDLYDFHCYDKFDVLAKRVQGLADGIMDVPLLYAPDWAEEDHLRYVAGKPINASEIGGIAFSVQDKVLDDSKVAWGYTSICGEDIFVEQYKQLVSCLLQSPYVSGLCYTQLYDVEQEQNGFFTYDRKPKFSETTIQKIAQCTLQDAAIEQNNTKK